MFQLTAAEKAEVVTNCDYLQKLKFPRRCLWLFKSLQMRQRVMEKGVISYL